MKSRRAFVFLAVAAAYGCSQDISVPTARTPVGLAADLGAGGAGDVVMKGATPDDPVGDDGPAIQAALNASAHVYFPAGTYHVDEGLVIPSGDTISGAGGAAVTIVQRNASVYYVFTSSGASNITIQDVGFQAANHSTGYQFGYKAVDVHNLAFLRNRATDMGLLQTTVSVDNPDLTPGFNNSMLSSNVRIENNHGVGPEVDANGHYTPGYGIWLRFTRDVTSFGNLVQRYQFGIGWDGGESDPGKQPDTLKLKNRWAKQMVFEQDTAKDVDTGIWGSRGDSMQVNHGWVEHCRDVCLDAEGSSNITFFNNQARYAGTAVLSVFHYSSGVTFSWNDVRQDGRLETNVHDTVGVWRQMFWSSFQGLNGVAANGVTATLANNFFTYEGSSSFGLISKSPMAVFTADNNWLRNTLIDVDMNGAGAVHITGDSITLTRPMGQPAIKVGHNYMALGAPAPYVNSTYRVEIGGNNIYLGYPTLYAQGILLTESATGYTISSWIHNNNIRGMSSAIQAVSCGSACPVLIENNTVTGSITPSSTSGSVTVRNNTRVP